MKHDCRKLTVYDVSGQGWCGKCGKKMGRRGPPRRRSSDRTSYSCHGIDRPKSSECRKGEHCIHWWKGWKACCGCEEAP